MLFKQNARPDQPTARPAEAATKPAETTPAAKLSFPPALAERAPAHPVAPGAGPETDEREIGKRLIVGKGIQLKGEITACDRLVVEGQVEVTMNATRALEIKPSGHFIGSCEVEEAEVSGIYEGDLTVRGRLSVHSTGRVKGKISYGELELARGGQIAGELNVREQSQAAQRKPFGSRNAA
jgi:cytoskeletal protein CcmA (bactofilin family)